jgi:deoxyribose-phosphate aldolase
MRRFHLITEADARVLDYGSTVVLVAAGHVTPLVHDTLKERRVTVVRDGTDVDAESLAPPGEIRTVAIASDHTGVVLKKVILQHLRGRGVAVHDLGTDTSEPVDYPDTAASIAVQVARGEAAAGVVIDGAGLGSTIAAKYGFASVCVNATWVATCARLLKGSRVKVCAVVGFPLGATTAGTKQFETRRAIFDGAREIDMVINVGALKSGDLRRVERDIEAVTGPCRESGAVSKVIIEAALLSDDEKDAACVLAREVGADFVKTSTGFGPGGATAHDVALMRHVVGGERGVKAGGGVKDFEGLQAMVAVGATRIGSSVDVHIVQESRAQAKAEKAGT